MKELDDINILIKDAKEKSWRQINAIQAIGELGDPQGVEPLIELLSIKLPNAHAN